MRMTQFRVIVDDEPCKACGKGAFYTVVSGEGEEECGVGSSWADQETAQDICDLMNMAYDAGVQDGVEVEDIENGFASDASDEPPR
jgi:hypothetical protein